MLRLLRRAGTGSSFDRSGEDTEPSIGKQRPEEGDYDDYEEEKKRRKYSKRNKKYQGSDSASGLQHLKLCSTHRGRDRHARRWFLDQNLDKKIGHKDRRDQKISLPIDKEWLIRPRWKGLHEKICIGGKLRWDVPFGTSA